MNDVKTGGILYSTHISPMAVQNIAGKGGFEGGLSEALHKIWDKFASFFNLSDASKARELLRELNGDHLTVRQAQGKFEELKKLVTSGQDRLFEIGDSFKIFTQDAVITIAKGDRAEGEDRISVEKLPNEAGDTVDGKLKEARGERIEFLTGSAKTIEHAIETAKGELDRDKAYLEKARQDLSASNAKYKKLTGHKDGTDADNLNEELKNTRALIKNIKTDLSNINSAIRKHEFNVHNAGSAIKGFGEKLAEVTAELKKLEGETKTAAEEQSVAGTGISQPENTLAENAPGASVKKLDIQDREVSVLKREEKKDFPFTYRLIDNKLHVQIGNAKGKALFTEIDGKLAVVSSAPNAPKTRYETIENNEDSLFDRLKINDKQKSFFLGQKINKDNILNIFHDAVKVTRGKESYVKAEDENGQQLWLKSDDRRLKQEEYKTVESGVHFSAT